MSNIPISERRHWLGASESAALFGVSPYISHWELWHTKAGNLPPHNLDGQERVEAGNFLEAGIAAWASHKWHWPIRNVEDYLEHPAVGRMGASLDFATLDGAPVEVKNVDNLVFRDGEWEADGDELVDAPDHFLIQVQHQLACRPHATEGHLLVCVGGNRLYRMPVPRHERMIDRIETKVTEFWQSIAEGHEPEPNFDVDADAIALLYSEQGDAVLDWRDNERFTELCAEYLAAHEIEKAGKTRKATALAEIRFAMKDAAMALGAENYRVKASPIKEATIYRKAHRRFSITQPKEKKS